MARSCWSNALWSRHLIEPTALTLLAPGHRSTPTRSTSTLRGHDLRRAAPLKVQPWVAAGDELCVHRDRAVLDPDHGRRVRDADTTTGDRGDVDAVMHQRPLRLQGESERLAQAGDRSKG